MALKEPNMNNPQRQLGVWSSNPPPALQELNISVKERTSHQGLFKFSHIRGMKNNI
jgi:hypothetical protein